MDRVWPAFPRRQRRGLIEARSASWTFAAWSAAFPRRQRRGLIEAAWGEVVRVKVEAPSPGGNAGASLKRAAQVRAAQVRAAPSPGGNAGASLKRRQLGLDVVCRHRLPPAATPGPH